jgi:guanylate kinase
LQDWLAAGRDVLFDIDWQGTQQIHARMRDDLVRVFILPPSAEELRDRLVRRAQDAASVVAKRMAEASNEISHWAEYDYVLINDDHGGVRCGHRINPQGGAAAPPPARWAGYIRAQVAQASLAFAAK